MTESEKLVHRVSFRDSDHTYHLDGKRIPSVTGILGNLSKPALVWWSAKMGAEAVKARVLAAGEELPAPLLPSNAEVLADELYELAQRAHLVRVKKATTKGSLVHDAVQRYHEDFFGAERPEDEAAARAWDAFIAWWAESGLTMVSVERKIVDPQGRYAGRLDLLARDEAGLLYVLDMKTSNGVYPEAIIQNAAYAAALEAELGEEIAGTRVLWLPEALDYMVVVERDREEWLSDYSTIFEPLLTIHPYRRALDKWTQEIKETHIPKVQVEA